MLRWIIIIFAIGLLGFAIGSGNPDTPAQPSVTAKEGEINLVESPASTPYVNGPKSPPPGQ